MSIPVVDPSRRFGGIGRLYGAAGAEAIFRAHVAVVGIGGVGSWAAEALARSGVGQITLIDLDHVAESNINRQIHANDATLGQAKVLAMQARIAAFHPQCRVHTVDDFVDADNWPALLPEPVDAVIDACDHMAAKTAMAAWARAQKSLFITVGAAGGKQSPCWSKWMIWHVPHTTPCWRNCASACANGTAPHATAKPLALPAFSAAKACSILRPQAVKQPAATAASTATATAHPSPLPPPLACAPPAGCCNNWLAKRQQRPLEPFAVRLFSH